jgi:hypothetical protein
MEVNGHLPSPITYCVTADLICLLWRGYESLNPLEVAPLFLTYAACGLVCTPITVSRFFLRCGTVYEQSICEFSLVAVLSFHQAFVLRPSYVLVRVGVNQK